MMHFNLKFNLNWKFKLNLKAPGLGLLPVAQKEEHSESQTHECDNFKFKGVVPTPP